MPDIIALFLVFVVSLFFYRSGYYDKRRTKELKLHDSVKFIYGKRGEPIYREGCLIQTFGLILGFSIFLEDFALVQGIPILVSARAIFAVSFLILAIAVLLDELLDRIRHWLW